MDEDEGEGPNLVWVGILLAITGSLMSALGLVVQKKSHLNNAELEMDERQGFLTRPLWIVGFLLFAGGKLVDVVSLGFAPQSIVSALATLVLVGNAFFAPCIIGEKLSRKDMFATLMIIVGATICVVFGSKANPDFDTDKLMSLFFEIGFVVFFIIVLLVALTCLILIHVFEAEFKRPVAIVNGVELEEIPADGDVRVISVVHPDCYNLETPKSKFLGLAYAYVCGLMSAFNLLFSKMIVELLKTTFLLKDNQFTNVLTYVFLTVFVLNNLAQLKFLQKCLANFAALFMIPVYQVLFTLLAILAGGIYFQEFNEFAVHQAVLFPLGVAIAICGVAVLSVREVRHLPRVVVWTVESAHQATQKFRSLINPNQVAPANGFDTDYSEETGSIGEDGTGVYAGPTRRHKFKNGAVALEEDSGEVSGSYYGESESRRPSTAGRRSRPTSGVSRRSNSPGPPSYGVVLMSPKASIFPDGTTFVAHSSSERVPGGSANSSLRTRSKSERGSSAKRERTVAWGGEEIAGGRRSRSSRNRSGRSSRASKASSSARRADRRHSGGANESTGGGYMSDGEYSGYSTSSRRAHSDSELRSSLARPPLRASNSQSQFVSRGGGGGGNDRRSADQSPSRSGAAIVPGAGGGGGGGGGGRGGEGRRSRTAARSADVARRENRRRGRRMSVGSTILPSETVERPDLEGGPRTHRSMASMEEEGMESTPSQRRRGPSFVASPISPRMNFSLGGVLVLS